LEKASEEEGRSKKTRPPSSFRGGEVDRLRKDTIVREKKGIAKSREESSGKKKKRKGRTIPKKKTLKKPIMKAFYSRSRAKGGGLCKKEKKSLSGGNPIRGCTKSYPRAGRN